MDFSSLIEYVKDKLTVSPGRIIGIDIGLSAVKIAEVQVSKNKIKILNFMSEPLPEGCLLDDEILKPEEITEALRDAVGNARLGKVIGCIGLSGPNTITKKLQVAGGSDEEIEDQVAWEAEQYVPFGIDDAIISHDVIGENMGGGVDVIFAAAKIEIINSFKSIAEDADIKIKVVDTNIAAIVNVFEFALSKQLSKSDDSWLFIDFGAQKTEFIIYRAGSILFSKEMNIGGIVITEEIQRKMGLNYQDAENLKKNGDGSGNLPEEVEIIVEDVMEAFFAEVNKTWDFYVTSTSDEEMAGIYLTGGGALIPGLVEGLEAIFDTEVEVFNPFDYIEFDKKNIQGKNLHTAMYTGIVAFGLGIRRDN